MNTRPPIRGYTTASEKFESVNPRPTDVSEEPSRVEGIRRIDWRFLLPSGPSVEHLVLLGGTAHMATQLQEMGTARRVSCSLEGSDPADAVAVLADTWVPPEKLARLLVPGGLLLFEVDRRGQHVRVSPARFFAMLRRAGFSSATMYWASGGHDSCSMYLPLRSKAALSWYFDRHFRAHTFSRRVLRTALYPLTHWNARRFGALVPCYAVVARLTSAGVGCPSILGSGKFSSPLEGAVMDTLLALGGEAAWSRVALFPFLENAAQPAAVVKVPRTCEFNQEMDHEQVVLQQLRDLLGEPEAQSLPKPLGGYTWRGLRTAAESYMPGKSLSSGAIVSRGRAGWIDDLGLAAAWLQNFHRRTLQDRPSCRGQFDSLVTEPLAEYADAFGVTPVEQQLFAAYIERTRELADVTIPQVWQHRDYGPWNLYRENGRLGVIDWEVARIGPALCDLLYFTMHWTWMARPYADEIKRRGDLHSLFVAKHSRDSLIRAARAEIRAYLQALDIEPSLVPVLLVHTLVNQAVDRAKRLRAYGGKGAVCRGENRYVGYVDSLAEQTEQLFGETAEILL